jgi:predicted DNA-binding transcriptional regulator AlpA
LTVPASAAIAATPSALPVRPANSSENLLCRRRPLVMGAMAWTSSPPTLQKEAFVKPGTLSAAHSYLVTVFDLADMLGVDQATIRRWCITDKLPPPLKLAGKVLRWKRAEIVAWLEKQQTKT